jgi:hypothetical protein
MKTATITADHITYMCELLPTETDVSRLWKIEKQQPKSGFEYYNAMILSYHWFYYHNYNCEYNASIQRKVEALD